MQQQTKRNRSLISLQPKVSCVVRPVRKKTRFEESDSSINTDNTPSSSNPYQFSDMCTSKSGRPLVDRNPEMAAPQLPLIFATQGLGLINPFADDGSRMSVSSGAQSPRVMSQHPVDIELNPDQRTEIIFDDDIDMLKRRFETSCSVTNKSPSVCSATESGSWVSFPSNWASVEDVRTYVMEIDSNRPIDTFSKEELTNIELAAWYLDTLACPEDAFSIMAMLLKREKVDRLWKRSKNRTYALLLYARSAHLPPQLEIADLIMQELEKLNKPPIERFLAHAAIAWNFSKSNRDDLAAEELGRALAASGTGDPAYLFSQLPAHDRRLDIIVYCDVLRCVILQYTSMEDLINLRKRWPELDPLIKWNLEKCFLIVDPGPFELKDGKLGKTCLRDCLAWCVAQIYHMPALPGIWKSKKYTLESRWWAITVTLFTSLWDRCYEDRSSPGETEQAGYANLSWREETEEQIGLPPATLLMTFCHIATLPIFFTKQHHLSDGGILQQLRDELNKLVNSHDSDLAVSVLRARVCMNSSGFWDEHREEFRRVTRNHFLRKLERCLRLRVPDLPICNVSSDRTSFQVFEPLRIVTARMLPTMASSLSSPELLSMRNLRDKIGRKAESLRKMGRNLPSAVLRHSGSQISLRSMDSLSTALQSLSLSISQPSSSSRHRQPFRQSQQISGRTEEMQDNMQSSVRSRTSSVQHSPLCLL